MGKFNIIIPDFIIIGANKSGTTSVAYYLSQHPEIKISTVKEPMFFSTKSSRISSTKKDASLDKPYYAITLEQYSSMFEEYEETTKLFGEASTSYLASPKMPSDLIKKIAPNVKLIAILREPTSRALSAYKMCYGNGIENRSFSEIVADANSQSTILPEHGVKEYIRNGLYSQLLPSYLNLFDRSNLLFLKYDDLVHNIDTFMEKILSFINASPYKFKTDILYNTAKSNLKHELIIDKNDFDLLRKFYQDDIKETEAITGLDLSTWKIP